MCLVAVGLVASFEIKTVRPKTLSVEEGGSMELYCAVDGYYEWCTFKRQDGKICDFEWKRDLWDLDVLQCSDFEGRYTRTGNLIIHSAIYVQHWCASTQHFTQISCTSK